MRREYKRDSDFIVSVRLRAFASAIRGQSETTGVAIGVALVVVLAAAVGVFVFADSSDSDDDAVLATLDSDVTVSTLTVSHSGGDTLDPENVRVVLEGNTTIHDSSLAAFSDPASSNETVDAGDTWQQTLTRFISEAQLRVIHEPTNTILHEQTHSVTLPEDSLTLSIDGATNSTELPGDATAASDSDVRVPYTVRGTFDGGETVDVTDSATLAVASDSPLSTTGNGTIQIQEPSGDSQIVTVTANFQNRVSNAVTVTVRDGVNHTVAIDNSTTTNNSVSVNYTVTNEGTITGQQDIEFVVVGNGTVDTTPGVTLAPGDSYTGQFTQTLNVTNATVTVRTADDSASKLFSSASIAYAGDSSVSVHETTGWQLKQSFSENSVISIDASPAGASLAYKSDSVYIRWTDNWTIEQTLPTGSLRLSLAWSPDGSNFIISRHLFTNLGLPYAAVQIYQTGNWQVKQTISVNEGDCQAYCNIGFFDITTAWSPDGSYIATAANKTVYVHETENWQPEQNLTDPEGVNKDTLTWSPDGSHLAYAAGDTVYVYGTTNWQLQQTVSETDTPVGGVAWSPDGSQLAYGANTSVYVHDTDDWQLDRTLTKAEGQISSAEWSPAGVYLAYGSADANVYVHETSDWTLAQQLTNAEGEIFDLTFIP